jgi:hypothetical protein
MPKRVHEESDGQQAANDSGEESDTTTVSDSFQRVDYAPLFRIAEKIPKKQQGFTQVCFSSNTTTFPLRHRRMVSSTLSTHDRENGARIANSDCSHSPNLRNLCRTKFLHWQICCVISILPNAAVQCANVHQKCHVDHGHNCLHFVSLVEAMKQKEHRLNKSILILQKARCCFLVLVLLTHLFIDCLDVKPMEASVLKVKLGIHDFLIPSDALAQFSLLSVDSLSTAVRALHQVNIFPSQIIS